MSTSVGKNLQSRIDLATILSKLYQQATKALEFGKYELTSKDAVKVFDLWQATWSSVGTSKVDIRLHDSVYKAEIVNLVKLSLRQTSHRIKTDMRLWFPLS